MKAAANPMHQRPGGPEVHRQGQEHRNPVQGSRGHRMACVPYAQGERWRSSGKANPNWRHGGRSREVTELRLIANILARLRPT